MKEEKYYTLEEKRNLLTYGEDDQIKFKEYRDYCATFLKGKDKLTASDGFNHCLTMIKEATDINWEDVKWKGLHASMVSWFGVLNDRDNRVDLKFMDEK